MLKCVNDFISMAVIMAILGFALAGAAQVFTAKEPSRRIEYLAASSEGVYLTEQVARQLPRNLLLKKFTGS